MMGHWFLLEREKFDAGYGIPDSLNSVSRGGARMV